MGRQGIRPGSLLAANLPPCWRMAVRQRKVAWLPDLGGPGHVLGGGIFGRGRFGRLPNKKKPRKTGAIGASSGSL
jgi:hypothetical protein